LRLTILVRQFICIIYFLSGGLNAVMAADLPSMGGSADAYLNPEQEKRLADSFMRNVRQSLIVVDDAELDDYISNLGYRLVANSEQHNMEFNFFIVQEPAINAFAAPGGYIGINSGLFLDTRSEGELASVLAHEIAHITQKHLARAIEKASKISLPTTAALIAAIILSSQNSQLGQAAITATAAGASQAQINFTRGNEQEADMVGIQTLSRAGFDPRDMPLFFDRLQKASRLYNDNVPEFLQTHPVTHDRIAETMSRAERLPRGTGASSRMYYLARAKLRVLTSSNPKHAVSFFRAQLNNTTSDEQEAVHYGYALALGKTEQLGTARTELEKLIDHHPDQISYIVAMAQLEIAEGHTDTGLRRFSKALQIYPNNRPLTLYYSKALIDAGDGQHARQLLAPLLRSADAKPTEYQLMARAQELSGRISAAHEALAEYYFQIGDTRSAIEQLGFALDSLAPDDRTRKARINARLAQLKHEALLETQAKEDK